MSHLNTEPQISSTTSSPPPSTAVPAEAIVPGAMRSLVCTRYGSPEHLVVQTVNTPEPAADQLLIKVSAATVTAADSLMRQGNSLLGRLFLGFNKPRIPTPGTGFAGTVVQRGENVKGFDPGDRVFGETGMLFAAHAEYICLPANGLLLRTPDKLPDQEAATLCDGALTSYNFLFILSKLKPGERVLINGASGGLGTAAVQLAKQSGAHVTAVCSENNVALVLSLGADSAIDYNTTDFSKTTEPFDVIYDCVGKSSYLQCRAALTRNGRYASPVLSMPLLLMMLWTHKFSAKKALFSATGVKPLAELKPMLAHTLERFETGKLRTVIDRSYALEDAAQANAYVDTGHKRGNVTLSF